MRKPISIIAIVDTLLALWLFFSMISLHATFLWWIAIMSAPLLLLRSEASNDLAAQIYTNYTGKIEAPGLLMNNYVNIFCLIYLTAKLANYVTIQLFTENFLCRFECNSPSTIAIAILFSILIISLFGGILFAILGRTIASAIGTMFCALYIFMVVWHASDIAYLVAFVFGYFLCISLTLPYIIGVWLRAICIKQACNLIFFRQGVREIPDNWHHIVFASHMEILEKNFSFAPDSKYIFYELSIDKKIHEIKRHESYFMKFICSFQIICFAIIGYIYRFAIKGTCWAWWPLAFAGNPMDNLTVSKHKELNLIEEARLHLMRLNNLGSKPSIAVLFFLFCLLIYFAFPQMTELPYIFPPEVKTVSKKLRENIRINMNSLQWTLNFLLILCIALYMHLVNRLCNLHKDVIEGKSALALDDESGIRFANRVRTVSYIWDRVVIILIYLISLSIALYASGVIYPNIVKPIFTDWFLGGRHS